MLQQHPFIKGSQKITNQIKRYPGKPAQYFMENLSVSKSSAGWRRPSSSCLVLYFYSSLASTSQTSPKPGRLFEETILLSDTSAISLNTWVLSSASISLPWIEKKCPLTVLNARGSIARPKILITPWHLAQHVTCALAVLSFLSIMLSRHWARTPLNQSPSQK